LREREENELENQTGSDGGFDGGADTGGGDRRSASGRRELFVADFADLVGLDRVSVDDSSDEVKEAKDENPIGVALVVVLWGQHGSGQGNNGSRDCGRAGAF